MASNVEDFVSLEDPTLDVCFCLGCVFFVFVVVVGSRGFRLDFMHDLITTLLALEPKVMF